MEKGWLNLEDRVVIVTGGASGIGKHTVQTLAAAVGGDMRKALGCLEFAAGAAARLHGENIDIAALL